MTEKEGARGELVEAVFVELTYKARKLVMFKIIGQDRCRKRGCIPHEKRSAIVAPAAKIVSRLVANQAVEFVDEGRQDRAVVLDVIAPCF